MNRNAETQAVLQAETTLMLDPKHKWTLEVDEAGAVFRRDFYAEDGEHAAQIAIDVGLIAPCPHQLWLAELDVQARKLLKGIGESGATYVVKDYPSGEWGLVPRQAD